MNYGHLYFFGRENLREATNSLLEMREPSPKERLHRTFVRDISLRPIDWTVKCNSKLSDVVDKLKKEPERWFIPIVKDDGSLEDVIKDEAIWRFVDYESQIEKHYKDIMQKNVSDVLDYLKKNPELSRISENVYISTTLDKSAGETYDLMQNKGISLAVVTDEDGKPTQYFDTGDVRRLLLKFS